MGVKEEAKEIMDDFMEKLEDVEEPEKYGIHRDEAMRDAEVNDWPEDFQIKLLNNAPKTRDNCIVGEKKDW